MPYAVDISEAPLVGARIFSHRLRQRNARATGALRFPQLRAAVSAVERDAIRDLVLVEDECTLNRASLSP
jgi:hypothetical protein